MTARSIAMAAILVALTARPSPTVGQQPATQPGSILEQLRRRARVSELLPRAGHPAAAVLALEGPVDEADYRVGPGDVFTLSWGGALGTVHSVEVSADGHLVLPELGGMRVAELTLTEARELVRGRLRESHANVPVEVALERPRLFYVHVVGSVPRPGRHLVTAVARVEDAIRQAFSGSEAVEDTASMDTVDQPARPMPGAERPGLSREYRPSLRTVRVTHRDGTSQGVDLLMYYATGHTAMNPYLRDGDVVEVLPYHTVFESVEVSGPLPFPGSYPFRPGDTALDLLRIASTGRPLSKIGEVQLARRAEGGARVWSLDVPAVLEGRTPDPELQAGDRVIVGRTEQASATIEGWVRFPGSYPIDEGVTTLKQLLDFAGGVRTEGDVETAYLLRGDPTLIKPEAGAADLDFFGREFLESAKNTSRIAVDLSRLVAGDESFALSDGDVAVFPRAQDVVYVVGNVPSGGYVPYRQGQVAAWYVEAAGGAADGTRSVYVFEATSGRVATGLDTPVPRGATVFVDRDPVAESIEMATLLSSTENARRQMSAQMIISGLTALAAMVTAVVAVSR